MSDETRRPSPVPAGGPERTPPRRVLIVGGVAGGASAAARLRRLDETCRIVVFDRGPFVSFANCGLPYFVGDVIREEKDLIVASPQLFRERFEIEVRTRTEVLSIDRGARTIRVRDLASGRESEEPYTHLVLAPGARAVRPPIEGIDLPGVFVLRTIPDSTRLRRWIEERGARHAVVVGAGFIGLETAENLVHRGLAVSMVELGPQVMPPLDPEMAYSVEQRLRERGVDLHLGDAVAGLRQEGRRLRVSTRAGTELETDLVILAVGVRPEVGLAEAAGLALGSTGGIRVDASMRTDDPAIFAVGDAVEDRDVVTGQACLLPLAGPANRQGRLAADAICGRAGTFRGVQGTSVCGLFDLVVASTGATEKALVRAGVSGFEAVHLHPGNHVGYYPGAAQIHMKLLFDRSTGRVLGLQAVGGPGTERRVDVVAMAIQMGATVFDLEQAELCYAPQFGAAKDPVNLAGMIAANVLRGDLALAHWKVERPPDVLLLDVREAHEFAAGHVPGALNIPLTELRRRLDELPRDREIWLHCVVGQRAYYATRALAQRGHRVRNLSGGLRTREAVEATRG